MSNEKDILERHLASDISPCPVITFVLNFSMKRRSTNRTVFDCLNVNDKLKPFVNDYKINVIDVAYLSREMVNKFKSDFKIIADYFVQMRETGEYKPMTDNVNHVWELLLLMGSLTEDDKFKLEYYRGHRKEPMNMCEWLDKVVSEGEAKGEVKGAHKKAVNSTIRLIKMGKMTIGHL